jgi:hypothetical protein
MNNWFNGFPSNIHIHWFTTNDTGLNVSSKYSTLYNNENELVIRKPEEVYDTDATYSIEFNS